MPNKKKNLSGDRKYYTRTALGKKFYSYYSQEEADRKADEYRRLKERDVCNPDITVAEYVLRWYEKHKDKVGPHCAEEYYYRSKQIIDLMGRKLMRDVTPMFLENCVEEFACTRLKSTGDFPSQKYINQIVSVLKLVFKQARKERFFDYNYAEDISVKSRKVSKSGRERRSLSAEELDRILNFEHKYSPMIWFMLFCGLMPEELVPLKWSDIIYNEKSRSYSVDINKTALLMNSGKAVIRPDTAKTEYRLRKVAIPFPLSEWIESNSDKVGKNRLIFPDADGKCMSKSAVRGRFNTYLVDLDCKVCGKTKHSPKNKYEMTIDRFCMYDLRHTYITLLAAIDTPVRKTTALAGHSGSETADKYYIDYDRLSTDDDVKRLGDYLRTKKIYSSETLPNSTKSGEKEPATA